MVLIVIVDMYPDLVSFFAFQLSLELQQVQQNMDEQALLSKAVVEHLQKSVTKLEEEKFEMQVFSLCEEVLR
jgi:hypothetical protein